MYARIEESYKMYKRPDGHDFLKDARSVGVPVSLDSGSYRYAFAESRTETEMPAKKQKTLAGQAVDSFEYRLARSVRRLGMSLFMKLIYKTSFLMELVSSRVFLIGWTWLLTQRKEKKKF